MTLNSTKKNSRVFSILLIYLVSNIAASTSTIVKSHMQTLTVGQSLGEIKFPEGTEVEILDKSNRPSGYLILHGDFLFDKILLKSGTGLWVAGPKIHLQSFTSEPGQEIYGIHLPANSKINLYDDGNVDSLYADGPVTIKGITYAKWRWIKFYPNGNVQEGQLAKNTDLSGLHARPGLVKFYEDGKIKEASIVNGSFYKGLKLASDPNATNDGDVVIWNNGNLEKGILDVVTTLGNKECRPGNITFSRNGALDSCNE